VKITFESEQLPETHPAWRDDRSGLISRRWWNVTMIDDNGETFTGTARRECSITEIIAELIRPERPSETVMRLLDDQRRRPHPEGHDGQPCVCPH
jgi:hypothetical protein